ncbi:MAG: hypothetical protein M3Y05_10450 [Gemmatimonadota bacterium]|nr:hypothetical protein [Gemmatimonadota bacterium]
MVRSTSGSGPHLSLDSSASVGSTDERAGSIGNATWHLAPHDLEELRIAIERSLCEGEIRDANETAVDDELRRSLRTACATARLQRVRAEQLLMDVKQIWMSIPSMLATRTTERLGEIVTACIDEYYA